jgi:crotonobetainyl-CoA:carnitine CoA-transferase CaiB-like acyl-CoA transferase
MREGKGYDVILQAFCGMLSITGEPSGPPVRSPFSPVDQATGLHALIGIQAALLERERTGEGSSVEVSLFDTATGFLGYFLQGYWERGTEPQRPGSGHESLCPYEVFETADRPIILGVANDGLWQRFCRIAGLEQFVGEERFRTNAARVANRAETVALVRSVLATRSRDEWLRQLGDEGIPCSPLHSLGELSEHSHSSESGMLFSYEDKRRGAMRGVAQPVRFNGERASLRRSPPGHGEHSAEILRELGYSDSEIDRLEGEGSVRLSR